MRYFFRIATIVIVLSVIYAVYSLAREMSWSTTKTATVSESTSQITSRNKIYEDFYACFSTATVPDLDSIFKTMQFNGEVLKNFQLEYIRKKIEGGEDFDAPVSYALSGLRDSKGCFAKHPGSVRDFNAYGFTAEAEVLYFEPKLKFLKKGSFVANDSEYYWNRFEYKNKYYLIYEAVSGSDYLRWSFIVKGSTDMEKFERLMIDTYFSKLTLEPAKF